MLSVWRQRLIEADRDLAEAKQKVAAQWELIHGLEALGCNDVRAQEKLEALLENSMLHNSNV